MKHFLFSILLFLQFQQIFSQSDAVVSGRIFDKTTSDPLSFASVSIINSSSGKLLTGALTDETGRFTITAIPQGEYSVTCSFIGYGQKKITLLVGRLNKNFDLGKIELKPEARGQGTERRDK